MRVGTVLLVVAVVVLAGRPAAAQVSLYGFQQYSWTSTLPASGTNVPGRTGEPASPADVQISHRVKFGAAVTVDVADRVAVEFMWLRHDLEAQIGTAPDQTEIPLHLHASSYLGHVIYRLRPKHRWTPFVFAGVGLTTVAAEIPERQAAFDAGVGALLPLHGQKLGLRVQGRVAPMPTARTSTPRTVYGRANTGTYVVAPNPSAIAAEVFVGITTTF